MPVHICKECGTSYADAPSPPARWPICEDERQYLPRTGQAWTTPDELSASHVNTWRLLEPDLFELHTQPDSRSVSGRCSFGRRRETSCGTASP